MNGPALQQSGLREAGAGQKQQVQQAERHRIHLQSTVSGHSRASAMPMKAGKTRVLLGIILACGLSAQEGDLTQKEKAQREKQMRERNAQPKTVQPNTPNPTPPPADPSTVGTAGRKKKSETTPPTKPEKPPQ
jgi:hypothetical protein